MMLLDGEEKQEVSVFNTEPVGAVSKPQWASSGAGSGG